MLRAETILFKNTISLILTEPICAKITTEAAPSEKRDGVLNPILVMSKVNNCYKSRYTLESKVFNRKNILAVSLIVVLGSTIVNTVSAASLTVHVGSASGGQVANLLDSSICGGECVSTGLDGQLVSLLAQSMPGYRFERWGGACETTLSPLCTLFVADQDTTASAYFTQEKESTLPWQGVLLLHGADEGPAIWNRVVDRQFNGYCPVIYGGVLFEETSTLDSHSLHCYRIRFGYYSALYEEKPTLEQNEDRSHLQERSTEIRAAVAGIQDAHPIHHIILVGTGSAVSAAQHFLHRSVPDQEGVTALFSVSHTESSSLSSTSNDPVSSHPAITEVNESAIAEKAWEQIRPR